MNFNNLIIQWGLTTIGYLAAGVTTTLPTAYTTMFRVIACPRGTQGGALWGSNTVTYLPTGNLTSICTGIYGGNFNGGLDFITIGF